MTFTATVTPSTATGQVQFLDGTQVIGSSNLASGIASFTTTLSDGTHSLTASYLGSTSYATSTSAAVSVTVGNTSAIPTSVSLNASNASIQAGQTVTLNATVSPLLATGQVQFLDGATSIGVVNLQAGAALFNASGLAAGQHTLTAHYLGSSLYSPSTSSPVLVTVISAATSLALTLSSSTLAVGRPLVMTATIDSSSATGRVRFLDGQTLLGATRFVGGRASFTVASLKRGTHSIWAVYDGDSSTSRLQTPVQTVVVGSSKVKPPPKVQSVSLKRGAQPTVRIVFSQAINGDLAQDIRDYAIRTLGKKGRIIPILRASYAVAGRSVTLALQGRVLTRDTVRLTIDASRIVNVSGALLDGNGDGRGGDNYNRTIG